MARILVHAVAATAGGGKTYLDALFRRLTGDPGEHDWTVLLPPSAQAPPETSRFHPRPVHRSGRLARVWFDQVELARRVRDEQYDVLLATGNFAMLRPPIPQVLMCRNPLYFSTTHVRQLLQRRRVGELANILLRQRWAIASVRASLLNVAPSQAFVDTLRAYVPELAEDRFAALHHGFDHAAFAAGDRATPFTKLPPACGARRVLFVSHYNYFRNFETLLQAFARLRDSRRPEQAPVELVLTTHLAPGVHCHRYDTTGAARLIDRLGIADGVRMLGPVSRRELPALQRACDVVVCPSYAETFGHPLVEAMACGRPLVASDTAVHREICGGAAVHVAPFDVAGWARGIQRVLEDETLASWMRIAGPRRAREFSWDRHFAGLDGILEQALGRPVVRPFVPSEPATEPAFAGTTEERAA